MPNRKSVKTELQKFSIFNSQIQERKPEKGRRVTKTEKRKPGWAWFDHDSVGHLERIRVIILSLLIHEHVICLILSPLNVLIKFYNHQRDLEHCMYKYIY